MPTWTAINSQGYPSPVGLSADVVMLTVRDRLLQVLLLEREALGARVLPGGFVRPEERPEQAALRHLEREAGLGEHYLEQLGVFGDPHRDDRGWVPAVAYLALVPGDVEPARPDADWRPVADTGPLGYDHADMLARGLDRVRGKLWWSNVAVGVLPGPFAMSEARIVYEAIAGQRYDPSTFARDLRATGLVAATGEKRREGPGRPAELYRFASHELAWGAGRRKRVG